jgi:hypothetical protein
MTMAAAFVPENHDANLRAAIEGLSPPSNNSPSSTRLTPESDDDSDIARDENGFELKPLQSEPQDGPSGGREWRRLAEQDRQGAIEDADAEKSPYTAAEEKAVVKKLDRRLVVFMALL